jgi:glycosyltransferase involved in cell wall biosynthesis
MKNIPKAFILFPDTWLSYSPSIINLVKVMKENGWDVTLLAFHDGSYQRTDEIEAIYLQPSQIMRRVIGILKFFSLYRFIALSLLSWKFSKQKFELVIGVDSLGFLITRIFFDRPIYYSLHIRKVFSSYVIKKLGISRVIIQSQERLELEFQGHSYRPPNAWYIQNSPILDSTLRASCRSDRQKIKLIYFGNVARNVYNIENCIEVLFHLPEDFSLTLKGPIANEYQRELEFIYGEFIDSGRLSFDSNYLAQDAVVSWLEDFDIGLCFYSELQIFSQDPNIISAPSGKLFNYLAAGLPVVGSKIPGLRILTEFGAGITLEKQLPEEIGAAVLEILKTYDKFKQGCREAALKNDFRIMANNFLTDITTTLKKA